MTKTLVTLFLCGDVMLGRGIDQILPHPSDPVLYESYVRDARDYVWLAEQANGPIPRAAAPSYVWGDALEALDREAPDARIVNLETSITRSPDPWPGKGIHYRMHPANIDCLRAAGIDCCVLGNNHVLDWGRAGLAETLATLHAAGIRTAGAGRDLPEARAPAVLDPPGAGRVRVFSFTFPTSGAPADWAAEADRSGVHLVKRVTGARIRDIGRDLRALRREGDILVASVHWGANWGYDIPRRQIRFARGLIDEGGADVVHGHSSHHVKAIEVYRGKLILYGCGDFLTDYEGIQGQQTFRGDLSLMYAADINPADGSLEELRMTPFQMRRFRLVRAGTADRQWLRETLNREGERFGTRVESDAEGRLILRWKGK